MGWKNVDSHKTILFKQTLTCSSRKINDFILHYITLSVSQERAFDVKVR